MATTRFVSAARRAERAMRVIAVVLVVCSIGLVAMAAPQIGQAISFPPAVAGQKCPAWVHDRYMTVGPDGRLYPTWHSQIDQQSGCWFGHEHGSDPSLVSPISRPAYGYVGQAAGHDEPHAGFKSFSFSDGRGRVWLITVHLGTAGAGRICERHHSLTILVADAGSRETLADIGLMADFGPAAANGTEAPIAPAACPGQTASAAASNGVRQIPIAGATGFAALGYYEPWRVHDGATAIGFRSGHLTFLTTAGMTACTTVSCASLARPDAPGAVYPAAGDGTARSVTLYANQSRTTRIAAAGAASGEFWSTPDGLSLMTARSAGSVRQFVRPGVDLSIDPALSGLFIAATDPWRGWMTPFAGSRRPGMSLAIDGRIEPPN